MDFPLDIEKEMVSVRCEMTDGYNQIRVWKRPRISIFCLNITRMLTFHQLAEHHPKAMQIKNRLIVFKPLANAVMGPLARA
jgi:hypothetical protein